MISINAENISKSYAKIKAIERISFEIKKNELFGFIGPDGAGKTTIFRILATLIKPDTGVVTLAGLDIVKDFKKIRHILGYMPGRFSLYQDLTVEENLKFYATIFDTTIEENYHIISNIYSHLAPFKTRQAGKLSGGMKQKLALCCALIHKPAVLILDEPTTGVDAVSRKEFWEMLKTLPDYGMTIVVSTPYMDEAGLCDRVALIQKGRILKTDSPHNIIKDYGKEIYAVRSANMYKLINDLTHFPGKDTVYPFGQYVHFTGNFLTEQLTKYLQDLGHDKIEITKISAGIEDCFMELMDKQSDKIVK